MNDLIELEKALLPFIHLWLDYQERNTFNDEDHQVTIIQYINSRCESEAMEDCFKNLYDTFMKGKVQS